MPVSGFGLDDLVRLVQSVISGNRVQVDSASSTLPAGAATEATLAAVNATLNAIDVGIPASTGQVTKANSLPVTLASDQDDPILGTTTDAAASSTVPEDATARTGIGLWKGIKNILILLNAKFAALGQAAMAASMPVTLASDQTDVPVTLDGEAITSVGTTISQTPTVTAGAYTAGDAVGGLLTFANAARVSTGGGVVKGIFIIDDAGQDAELELWLFNQTFTAMSDNAAWAPSEADLENCIGVISTGTSDRGWMAAGTPSVCDIEVSRRYDLTGTSLFGQLVTRGTPTFAATDDVTVKVLLLQD